MGLGFIEDIIKAPLKLTGLDKVFDKIQEWLTPDIDTSVDSIKIPRKGTDNPIPIVYGTREIGGVVVDRNVTDKPGGIENELLHIIVVWCAGEIEEIDEVYFNDVKSTDNRFKKNGGSKWFTVKHFTGTQAQSADPDVIANFNNANLNTKYTGIAYSYFVFEIDEEQNVWRGEPRIKAKIKGRKIYDPRTALTAYSSNPALCLYDYIRDPIWGKGLDNTDFIEQSIIDSADLCDEQQPSNVITNECVELNAGDVGYPYVPSDPVYGIPYRECNTTPGIINLNRFTFNAIINTDNTLFNNVKQILNSARASAILENGKIKLINEGAGDPVMLFGPSNIVGNIKSTSSTKRSRLNRVSVTFSNKSNRFKKDTVFYPPESDPLASQWLTEDNNVRLERTLNYDSITEKAEALRMAEVAAKVSRDSGTCSFTSFPIAAKLQPGDIIGVSDDTRGWDEKPFRVTELNRSDDGDVNIVAVEHNSTAYPWEQVDYDDTIGGTYLGNPSALAAPQNLTLALDETLATLGALSWTYSDDAFVKLYRVEIRDTVSDVIVKSFEERAKSTDVPLVPIGSYEISVFAVSTLGYTSLPATLALNASIPAPPDGIELIPDTFTIEAIPFFTGGLILGNQFEFGLGNTDVVTRGASTVFTGLNANTPYTVYARTVNAFGVSAWINAGTSTTDGQNIIDIVGDVDLSALDNIKVTWDEIVESVSDVFGDQINSVENLVNEKNIEIESETRNEQLAIVDAELVTLDATLDTLNNETIPQIEYDIAYLNNVTLVGIQSDLDNLNGVELPALQAQLDQAEIDIAANEVDITTLNTVTLPALQVEINNNESAINTLNTVTIPALNSDIGDNETAINTLNTVTIPAINSDISDNETAIDTLNTVTIPALEQDLTDLDDRFPVVTVDISDNAISAPKILANAVTASKIIAGAVTTDKMNANSINGDRITANTLNASKIVSGSITTDRMTANSIDGDRIAANTLNASKIVAFSISTSEIVAGGVNGDRITANTLNANKIVSGSITTDRMTVNTIDGDRLLINSLGANRITAGSITTDRMTANTINGDRIAAGTLNANKIVANSITGSEIAANSIGANEIIANSITADEIAANAIGASEIEANSITTSKILAAGVNADRLVAFSILANNISSNAITSDKIEANAISAEKIVSDALITRHFSADQIQGVHIQSNTISANNIVAGTITADKIAANTITSNEVQANSLDATVVDVDNLFAENITATGTISGAFLTGAVVAAFGDVSNTIPLYAESAFSGGLRGGAAIRGDYSGSGFFSDSASGGAVIGNYTGSDVAATAIKGIGGAGQAGVFYTDTNATCVYVNGGSNRAILVNNSFGFTCAHFQGATDIGVLIDSTGATGAPTQAGLKVIETSAFAGVRSEGDTWDFYADNGSGSYGPFTGGHDGLVLKAFTAEQGDIVCDGDVIARNGISDAILSMELSSQPMQKSCAGAFVLQHDLNERNRPAAMKGLDLSGFSQFDAITFNALGEGLINVCGEGGNIEKGDYICTSSIAGKGMKQPQPDDLKSYTVAQARESVIFSSTTEVKQIAVIYKAG